LTTAPYAYVSTPLRTRVRTGYVRRRGDTHAVDVMPWVHAGTGYNSQMALTVEAMGDRPRPEDQLAQLFADGWPAFITADQEVKRHIGRVRAAFAELELVLLDSDDRIVAAAWSVPLRWNGDPEDLPSGYTDSLAQALDDRQRGESPDTLVIAAAQVHPDHRGRGVAGELLLAMRDLANRRGWPRVVAPVRPTLKARYPLTPIEEFATWTRADGAPLDPWIRTHWRLGARIIATAPRSQTMTGTVTEWESWTRMLFPASGEYIIPGGLATLQIDRGDDQGTYVEPNVWVQHQ
jgi:GNAT superfamily N-acetyltransferase